jgi:hypothetical protein
MKVRQQDSQVVNGTDAICTKFVEGKHAYLTPGVFTLSCAHGIVYGYTLAFTLCSISFLNGCIAINLFRFKVMTQAESPETVFSIMMRLFPNRKTII